MISSDIVTDLNSNAYSLIKKSLELTTNVDIFSNPSWKPERPIEDCDAFPPPPQTFFEPSQILKSRHFSAN